MQRIRFWLLVALTTTASSLSAQSFDLSAEVTLSAPVWFGTGLYAYMPEDIRGVQAAGPQDMMIPLPHVGTLWGLGTPIGKFYGMADLWLVNPAYFDVGLGYGGNWTPEVEGLTLVFTGVPGPHAGLAHLVRLSPALTSGWGLSLHAGGFVTVAGDLDLYPGILVGGSLSYRWDGGT